MKTELTSPAFIAALVIGGAIVFAAPLFLETYDLFNFTVFAIMAMLAISLNFVWGIGGILSLGQALFFGLGGYAYAITAINLGSGWGLLAAVAVPCLFALIVGYVAFYGRISDVYFGVVSLTISLILYNFVNSTSDAFYTIGTARLGGYNGIPSVPPIQAPWAAQPLGFEAMYVLCAMTALVFYLGVRLFVSAPFGRVIIAVRENDLRAELLGYDPRYHRLVVFAIGAAMSGLAGAFFAAWGAFIGPDTFSVSFAAQAIIWVLFGGLGTLIGPVVGALSVSWFTTWLGEVRLLDPNIALGLLFIVSVLLVPNGMVPALRKLLGRLRIVKERADP